MARTSKRARRSSHLYMPSAFDLFRPSKDLILSNIWIFGPLFAVPFIFWVHSWLWSPLPGQHVSFWQHSDTISAGWTASPLPAYPLYLYVGFSFMWLILALVAGLGALMLTQKAQLDAVEHKTLDFQDLWWAAKRQWRQLLGLYIVLGITVFVGFALFIVPGLLLMRRWMFAPYIMLEERTGISDSLAKSNSLTSKNPGAIWGMIGVMFLIVLVGIVPIVGGLAAFALGCLYSLAPALRYQQFKKLV